MNMPALLLPAIPILQPKLWLLSTYYTQFEAEGALNIFQRCSCLYRWGRLAITPLIYELSCPKMWGLGVSMEISSNEGLAPMAIEKIKKNLISSIAMGANHSFDLIYIEI